MSYKFRTFFDEIEFIDNTYHGIKKQDSYDYIKKQKTRIAARSENII